MVITKNVENYINQGDFLFVKIDNKLNKLIIVNIVIICFLFVLLIVAFVSFYYRHIYS